MAWTSLFTMDFVLVLLVNLLLLENDVFATYRTQRQSVDFGDKISVSKQRCSFNESMRTYNATDLILCMNELASAILLERNINSNRITDRAYQDSRQSYLAYPDYSMFSGASSNYFNDDTLTSLFSGASPLSGLINLFSGFTRPGFNLFNALSSIAQFDDLQCVPRILCEVASGSMPGSINYKQSSDYQDFGQNPLFKLLTAFDVTGSSSPILTFGRAALLGYTNRGQSSMCYHEYSRCPHRQDQLISYLNNHKGGFFRFFGANNRDSYYRPQQSPYRPYYRSPQNGLNEYRIVGSKTNYPSPQSYQKAEDDRTGTGKFSFINSNVFKKDNSSASDIPTKFRDSEFNKFVFPKKDHESYYESNRVTKSLNGFDNFGVDENERIALWKNQQLFPRDEVHYHSKPSYQADSNRRPRFEQSGITESFVIFPHDTHQKDNHRNY